MRTSPTREWKQVVLCALPWLLYALLMTLFGAPAHSQPTGRETAAPLVTAVDSIGMTVSDMDRAVDFYTQTLPFVKIADTEVYGTDWEHLEDCSA